MLILCAQFDVYQTLSFLNPKKRSMYMYQIFSLLEGGVWK
jgi:hypothetical protein